MATNTPTILDLKSSFLRSQILALSKPLRLSSGLPISADENALRQKSIDDALAKLNALLRKHNKVAYPPQAQRHVAEQIDRLYWAAGERGAAAQAEEWSERGADYRKEGMIEKLPDEWSEEAESRAPEQAAQYRALQGRLAELNERRRVARERVEQYRAAKKLLEPFEGEDAGVQANLVTRDGEVEKELERMRMLMLRVERGVMGLEGRDAVNGGDEMDLDLDLEREEEKKLLSLLGGK